MNNNREKVLSISYMDWLTNFSKTYPVFADFTFWFVSDEIVSYEEKKKIALISELYDAIKNYAQRNFIPSSNKNNGISYEIIYNGIGFCLTETIGKDVEIRCFREIINEMDISIDFYDVMYNRERNDKQEKINELRTLETYISSLLNEGIPEENIKSVVNETIYKKKVRSLKK